MAANLSVSVIVPSYQGVERLPGLLECFERQTTSRNWEVIIVLDGSTDGSRELLAQWKDKIPLRVLDRGYNRGRSVTLNDGYAAAVHDVLIRCDDDLLPSDSYVDDFAQALETNPQSGVLGLYRNVFPENRYARIYGRFADARFAADAQSIAKDNPWRLWGGNCAVTRSQWVTVGTYDEDFREYGWEDVDWGYRLVEAGFGIDVEARLATPHRLAAITAENRLYRARLSGRAEVRFEVKHHYSLDRKYDGLWGTLVRINSRFAGARWGAVLDRLFYVLPAKVVRRLIDLGVEAAYRRGRLEGQALQRS
jgi:glycosyltransferase involved in cell wall biosynthesis